MRPTNKSRSRSKGNRRPNGNSVNKVFESSGPDGKVRGNAQQIIDKYEALARDAFLAGDRVAGENFKQHCEHYIRVLGEAKANLENRMNGNGQTHFPNAQSTGLAVAQDLPEPLFPEGQAESAPASMDVVSDSSN